MKYLARAAVASIILFPVFVSAQSAADIAAQARALLDQIAQLQAQLGVSGGASDSAMTMCYSGGALKPGASGASVSALQQFLASDPSIYPEGKVTGYYGALTQAAVQRFQAKHGIVNSGTPATTGYGAVGPKTAAAMSAACGGASSGDPVVGGFIKVSPVSGNAPLNVSVETTINTVKSCLPATYTLSWGDNSNPLVISIPEGKCDVLAQTYTHTYSLGGSYTVKLSSGGHETSSIVDVNGGDTLSGGTTLGNSPTGGSASTGGSSANTASGSVVSGTLAISMKGGAFTPKNATVTSGTRVTWVNDDTASHTVSADNASYNSGTIAPGGTYSLTFTTKGEYTYYCAFHGGVNGVGMAGKITVQ